MFCCDLSCLYTCHLLYVILPSCVLYDHQCLWQGPHPSVKVLCSLLIYIHHNLLIILSLVLIANYCTLTSTDSSTSYLYLLAGITIV